MRKHNLDDITFFLRNTTGVVDTAAVCAMCALAMEVGPDRLNDGDILWKMSTGIVWG